MYLPLIMNVYRHLRQWHKRRKAIRELAALDDRLLNDIGIERSEIERLVDGRAKSSPSAAAACRLGRYSDSALTRDAGAAIHASGRLMAY